jgi:hypothetical protein
MGLQFSAENEDKGIKNIIEKAIFCTLYLSSDIENFPYFPILTSSDMRFCMGKIRIVTTWEMSASGHQIRGLFRRYHAVDNVERELVESLM